MIHIALYQPEIPPNTGNVIRLCANTGASLHLIHPLGFALEDKRMRRAGLDYHEWANITHHTNSSQFLEWMKDRTLLACSTKGKIAYHQHRFQEEDVLLFGQETKGLPEQLLNPEKAIYIPMQKNSRSLNLSNSVAIILFEALRQNDFDFFTKSCF